MRNSLLARVYGLFFWTGWHPEVALRYLPVVSEIKKLGGRPTVLDVGSGGLGIAPYLGYSITGVDLRFRPPYHRNLDRVKASATALPFADNVFDAVVSVDTLEHMDTQSRVKAVRELIRTAKKLTVIAVPCGKEGYLQDKLLSRLYRKRFKKRYTFFEEQLKLGLPEEKDILAAINQATAGLKTQVRIKIIDNENLGLREFLMKGWMSKGLPGNIFYRKIMLLAVPLMRRMNKRPVYRKIFVIRKK